MAANSPSNCVSGCSCWRDHALFQHQRPLSHLLLRDKFTTQYKLASLYEIVLVIPLSWHFWPPMLTTLWGSSSCSTVTGAQSLLSDASVCAQVVWTGGDKSTSLWCSYSGAFLGTIDRGKELGLPESSSFSRDSQPRSLADEWRAKVDTNKVRPHPKQRQALRPSAGAQRSSYVCTKQEQASCLHFFA